MSKHADSTRRYPRNSPQAAGQIVALALISNGDIKPCEWAELESTQVHEQLGLTRQEWHDVVGNLYFDLMGPSKPLADRLSDAQLIAQVLEGVDDEWLQRRVLRLCMAVINADHQVDEGESAVLRTAIDLWELDPEDRERVEPLLYGLDFQVLPRRTGRH
jgi:hypothetical protein